MNGCTNTSVHPFLCFHSTDKKREIIVGFDIHLEMRKVTKLLVYKILLETILRRSKFDANPNRT